MHVLAKHRSGFVRHRSRDMSWVETWVGVKKLENIVCFQWMLNDTVSTTQSSETRN
jgi:hypothetical protein